MKKFLTTIFFSFLITSLFSQELTLPSLADTYTLASSANDSYASEETLKLKHSVTGTNDRKSWLSFDISSISSTQYNQIILRLVKVGGDEGNISIVGTSIVNNSLTWNSAPTIEIPFKYGGKRNGDTCYLDVTDYVQSLIDDGADSSAFQLFTTSIITSAISFASNENTSINSRPQLLFYDQKEYEIPLYNIYNTVSIPTEKGNYTGHFFSAHELSTDERSTYGGWKKLHSTATGYFHTEKDCEGTWHIIDPEGYVFYSAGLNSVEKGGDINLPEDLVEIGLNTMGSWSDESIENFAYCPRFNVLVNFKNTSDEIKSVYEQDILPVFEPTFADFCATLAKEELPQYANDSWVLGFFLDNELLFHKLQLSLSLTLATDNPQYLEAHDYMVNAYGASYTTADITETDEANYQTHVAETYFSIVSNAFRTVDTQHMLIGTRFHGGTKYVEGILQAAGEHLDIISVNYYNRFEPEEEAMDMWLSQSQIPFMITEFYTKGEDSGLGNDDGAGWEVPTQQDRANWYENWMLKLLRSKGSVGYHWFRYIDKEGNDANKGLYSQSHVVYEPLQESFAKVSLPIYSLRSHILYGNTSYNDHIDCNQELCGEVTSCTTTTGLIIEPTSTNQLLYPNPVTSFDEIQFPKSTHKIILHSISNHQIKTIYIDNLSFSSSLKGFYWIECYDSSQHLILRSKLLIL